MDDGQPITVFVTTDGGAIADAHAMVAAMRLVRSPITVIGLGYVYSAGTILMQGATKGERKATAETLFLMHQSRPNFSAHGRPMDVFDNEYMARKVECEHINRSVAEALGMDYNQYMDFIFGEKIITAQQALELGLIDEIVEA
jgi:ATP-dependent Clp protease protease subunit